MAMGSKLSSTQGKQIQSKIQISIWEMLTIFTYRTREYRKFKKYFIIQFWSWMEQSTWQNKIFNSTEQFFLIAMKNHLFASQQNL